ncbi:gephyrin-like molybdotransferase Glp [Bordetella bronchialis]|uniref:Molybdopterin molybdenumtransferase n=1 Tax=Bordetella bronchialis TaxID=463025 RepID=A0ABM6CWT1_9BORD|nr:gephyrin-like molybdotransferase Glp [Bordetella bronchialis]ANN68591.1 molybdopterin molybdenumtransferase MoeA [Bordetella bronchialis]
MLDFDDAQTRLANGAPLPRATTETPLREAAGLVLARDLTATLDLPPADNSAMDGYALRHADYRPGATLPIDQVVYAGQAPGPLAPGHAARLFTGSLMPPGADTVVMQEDTRVVGDRLEITQAPRAGQHVRRRGEDTAAGSPLLPAGTRIGPAQIALLASQGIASVVVHPAVRVGILTTGDELVAPGQPREAHQIYNSNGAMMAALVEGMGARATQVLHAQDTETALRSAFQKLAQDCDMIVSIGGVSVGDKDLVKPVLESLGAELDLWRVRMKPGKPVAMAHIDGKPVVCLPGNPVSAFAVFTVLVSPLLRRMQGRRDLFPPVSRQRLRTDSPRQDSREEFLRVRLAIDDGGVAGLQPFDRQGSGVVSSLPWATGLARIPAGQTVRDGEMVAYYDFQHWLS